MPALKVLAVANYRSIRSRVMPLEQLNLITGANGSGKSNLYRIDHASGRFTLLFSQHGLLRPLSASELSDGTLRYLL